MKFGKILVSIYQPGSAAILNSIPGLEVIEGLGLTHFSADFYISIFLLIVLSMFQLSCFTCIFYLNFSFGVTFVIPCI